MKIEITVEDRDYLAHKVAELMIERLYDRTERDVAKDALDKAVREIVSEHASEMVPEMLRPRIEAALDGDFGVSDSYGHHKPRTLRAMIVDAFKGDTYNRDPIHKLVEAKVAELMKAEFQPQIDAARKVLREKLDHILGEKVSLAVREAIGLR